MSDMQSGMPNPRYGVVVTDSAGMSHYMPDLYQGEHTPEVRQEATLVASRTFAERRVEEMRYRRDMAELAVRTTSPQLGATPEEVAATQARLAETEQDLRNAEAGRAEVQGPEIIGSRIDELTNAFGEGSEVVSILTRLQAGVSDNPVADLERLRAIREEMPSGMFVPLEQRVQNNLLASVIAELTRE
jgi:hypothetical protein